MIVFIINLVRLFFSPRAWWKWAINKHITKIQIRRKHRSLDFVLKRAKLNVDYVRKYKAYLTTKYVQKSPVRIAVITYLSDFVSKQCCFDNCLY